MTTDTQYITTESLLEIVADPRRRTILRRLQEKGEGAVAIDELSETVVADGGRSTSRHLSEKQRAAIELQHTHLPRLAEAGLIEYNRSSETVRYLPHDRLEKLLQFVSTHLEG